MTCREKFISIHPRYSKEDVDRVVRVACPGEYNFLDDPEWCKTMTGPDRCVKCWDREIPEVQADPINLSREEITELHEIVEQANENAEEEKKMPNVKNTKAELLSEIKELGEKMKLLEKYARYKNCADELAVVRDSFIDAGFTRDEAMTIILAFMPR